MDVLEHDPPLSGERALRRWDEVPRAGRVAVAGAAVVAVVVAALGTVVVGTGALGDRASEPPAGAPAAQRPPTSSLAHPERLDLETWPLRGSLALSFRWRTGAPAQDAADALLRGLPGGRLVYAGQVADRTVIVAARPAAAVPPGGEAARARYQAIDGRWRTLPARAVDGGGFAVEVPVGDGRPPIGLVLRPVAPDR